ncbi:hypothetical protein GBA52_009264 [Prunus armeniaca]|nr:hypothetical protein GBA52_009264 [Prunus armeniaca]
MLCALRFSKTLVRLLKHSWPLFRAGLSLLKIKQAWSASSTFGAEKAHGWEGLGLTLGWPDPTYFTSVVIRINGSFNPTNEMRR